MRCILQWTLLQRDKLLKMNKWKFEESSKVSWCCNHCSFTEMTWPPQMTENVRLRSYSAFLLNVSLHVAVKTTKGRVTVFSTLAMVQFPPFNLFPDRRHMAHLKRIIPLKWFNSHAWLWCVMPVKLLWLHFPLHLFIEPSERVWTLCYVVENWSHCFPLNKALLYLPL